MTRAVGVLGDATSPEAWSGIPYHFWRAGVHSGFLTDALRVDLQRLVWPRRRWALGRLLCGGAPAGFQYSPACLDQAESQLPPELLTGEIISFNQHFPRAASVRKAGGRISYYLDATFAALATGRGLDLRLPRDVVKQAREIERENFKLADRVIAMARWTAASLEVDCGVPQHKIFTVLPGANLEAPSDWSPPAPAPGLPGKDRPLVLGFVGKDWRRKGLPLLAEVRDRLAERGWNAIVRVVGEAPGELAQRDGVEFCGFIDKRRNLTGFIDFLTSCDIGCLFSSREALGISTLEFLRVGVPVAGFAIEGPADTLPTDAGFRFSVDATSAHIADVFADYLKKENKRADLVASARRYASQVTWDRCLAEFQRIWRGEEAGSLRLWRPSA